MSNNGDPDNFEIVNQIIEIMIGHTIQRSACLLSNIFLFFPKVIKKGSIRPGIRIEPVV